MSLIWKERMASRKAACGPLNLLREKPCSFSDALFKNSSLGFPRPFKSAASTLHKARRLFARHFSASFSHACLRFLKGFAFQIPRERETMSVAEKKFNMSTCLGHAGFFAIYVAERKVET